MKFYAFLVCLFFLFGSALVAQDSDGDGLSDVRESTLGTNFMDQDTDDDGLGDGEEYASGKTNPLLADTDSDGIQDGTESGRTMGWPGDAANGILGTDPLIFIPDLDPATMTGPGNPDSDGGGLDDGAEDFNFNGLVEAGETYPESAGDDLFEFKISPIYANGLLGFQVQGRQPQHWVIPVFSVNGPGATCPPFSSFCFSLSKPIIPLSDHYPSKFPMLLDSNGDGLAVIQAPSTSQYLNPGGKLWWQTYECDGVFGSSEYISPVVTTRNMSQTLGVSGPLFDGQLVDLSVAYGLTNTDLYFFLGSQLGSDPYLTSVSNTGLSSPLFLGQTISDGFGRGQFSWTVSGIQGTEIYLSAVSVQGSVELVSTRGSFLGF